MRSTCRDVLRTMSRDPGRYPVLCGTRYGTRPETEEGVDPAVDARWRAPAAAAPPRERREKR
jgi:hypothetical protein